MWVRTTPDANTLRKAARMYVEDDCEDQALAETKTCFRWKCDHAPLKPVRRAGHSTTFWCCTKCGASYGVNPHPDCPDMNS